MCGRFTQNYTWEQIHAFLSVFGPPRNVQPHSNIAPTDTVDVFRLSKDGKRELVSMRSGLIPGSWKKSVKDVPATFNARAESVADKPMFRIAFKERRCIIPASGFMNGPGQRTHGNPICSPQPTARPSWALPELWDRWRAPASGEEILSCTIIVCGANDWMQKYHDRMPVILEAKNLDAWLNGTLGPEALKCAAEDGLREWPVSRRVNRAGEGDDDPTLIY